MESKPILRCSDLRTANIERQRLWDPDRKITALYRAVELGGEVGELLNVIKKLKREELGIRGSRASMQELSNELADVVICVDLIAMDQGIDLNLAVRRKFNMTSEKVDIPVILLIDDRVTRLI